VADLEAIRAELGYSKFTVLGDSYGGFVAMGYGATHAEHVGKLVLVDSMDAYADKGVLLFEQVFPDKVPRDPKTGQITDEAS
jgi:pimeloyl-ACP methyl ester carboxylesterase